MGGTFPTQACLAGIEEPRLPWAVRPSPERLVPSLVTLLAWHQRVLAPKPWILHVSPSLGAADTTLLCVPQGTRPAEPAASAQPLRQEASFATSRCLLGWSQCPKLLAVPGATTAGALSWRGLWRRALHILESCDHFPARLQLRGPSQARIWPLTLQTPAQSTSSALVTSRAARDLMSSRQAGVGDP